MGRPHLRHSKSYREEEVFLRAKEYEDFLEKEQREREEELKIPETESVDEVEKLTPKKSEEKKPHNSSPQNKPKTPAPTLPTKQSREKISVEELYDKWQKALAPNPSTTHPEAKNLMDKSSQHLSWRNTH